MENPPSSTALHYHAARGDLLRMRYELDAGADPNGTEPLMGETPLMAAASGGRTAAVALLLPFCDPHRRDLSGNTALMKAAYAGALESFRLLLPSSPAREPNDEGWTPLMLACASRRPEASRIALDLLPLSDLALVASDGLDARQVARANRANPEVFAVVESWRLAQIERVELARSSDPSAPKPRPSRSL